MLYSLDKNLYNLDPDNGINEEYHSVVFFCVGVDVNFIENLQNIFATDVHCWAFVKA